ncbi:hypothetical protein FGIG_00611 [Fasciola gigantica]|uniref:Amidase domain-containing protein n=1 Tax=Fasciola gigantica TaxID=46835 RepID=A0A504YV35_FASGI|nr:hypothetical protein FGIG_00611 [Fasciola gigantica]
MSKLVDLGDIQTHAWVPFMLQHRVRSSNSVTRRHRKFLALHKRILLVNNSPNSKGGSRYPPFGEHPPDRPLRIGYFTYDGSFKAVPAAERAVLHIKSRLEAMGHKLIPWQPPCPGSECFEMFLTALFVDGGARLVEMLQYDEVEQSMFLGLKIFKSWRLTRRIKWILAKLFSHPDNLIYMRAVNYVTDVPTLTQHVNSLEEFRYRWYDNWRESNLDAVLCPAFGMAAPVPVRTTRSFAGMLTYLHLFNITNMPAGSVPSGICVTEADLAPLRASLGQKDGNKPVKLAPGVTPYPIDRPWQKAAAELQVDTLGMPVGVQVAAAPWHDEMCLHVMREVERAARGVSQPGPTN